MFAQAAAYRISNTPLSMLPTLGQGLPRIALIGATGYGAIYLQLIREALQRKEIVFSAAVIINQDKVPDLVAGLKASGTVIYESAAEFFAREKGQIDLCLVPTGIQWHARLTISALQAGMNVLVEKPLAGSIADAQAIRNAEAATGHWVAVGFQDIYTLEARWIKNQLLAGVIGELRDISMLGLWPRSRAYFERTTWAGRAAADGAAVLDSPLNNAFAHFVNLALFFAGETAAESARVRIDSAELFRAHQIEMFDTAVVRGTTDSGARCWFGVSHTIANPRQPEIVLEGTAGRIEWWHEQRCTVLHSDGRSQVFPLPSSDHARMLMFETMLARLRDPQALVCTTSIAEKHTRLIEELQQAGPISQFPAASIDWKHDAESGSEIPVVQGLADALGVAFKEKTRLSNVLENNPSPLLSS